MHGSKTRFGLKAVTDPAVYQRVVELFSRAAELPVQDQPTFLQDRCGGDTDLRWLVENLLQGQADSNLPALNNAKNELQRLR